jgi:hypothetical protein
VVITISTYTEPVPVAAPANDTSQAHETDEKDESSSFAELLAGLLVDKENILSDIIPVDFSEVAGIEEFNGENLNLFGNINETVNIPENELAGIEIPNEYLSAAGVEHLPALIKPETELELDTEALADFQAEILGAGIINQTQPETQTKVDFSASDSTEAVLPDFDVSQIAAARASLEEETGGKKDFSHKETSANERISSKTEKTETFPAKDTQNNSDLHNKPENESLGRLDEMRSRSRRERLGFEIRDMRENVQSNSTHSYSTLDAAGRVSGEAPVREITLELRLPENSGSVGQTQAQTTWEARASSAIENMLARELHQNFNGDIVRHASMALRDGGEGTIRIALKPENLGNVKIRLEMSENKVTGHIFVESEEALNAFRKEISSLEEAFRESGFTDANLNLSLTAGGQNAEEWKKDTSSFTPQKVASLYDDDYHNDAVTMVDVFIGQNSGSINMLA